MAVSKKRETKAFKAPRNIGKPPSDNPKWLVPAFSTLLVIGPVWIVTSYVTQARYPLPIGNLNLMVGFGVLITALILLTRWK